ncbi:unnamed protein product, partial [Laminaria digitata]
AATPAAAAAAAAANGAGFSNGAATRSVLPCENKEFQDLATGAGARAVGCLVSSSVREPPELARRSSSPGPSPSAVTSSAP